MSYIQTDVADFSELGLTTKISADYAWVPNRWNLSGNVFYTALPISSNLPGIKLRALGWNLRVGYFFQPGFLGLDQRWKIGLQTGVYYSTTFVTNDAFGHKDLAGPQIYPSISRGFSNGSDITAYFKFSPISQRLSLKSLESYELATGIGYKLPVRVFDRPVSSTFDFVVDRILMSATEAAYFRSMTFSFSLGL